MRQRFARRAALLLPAILTLASCSRPAGLFVEQNARAHINMLAGTIGSRPPGTPANERARRYIVDQLTFYGYSVRVQEVDARRPELGRTARVANIVAVLPGERPEAIGLVSHYDSGFETPGAADDAFGVAVSLEAARSVASKPNRRWTVMVLVTDAEEAGLMGAAGLVTDREVRDRLRAYVNVDAAGSAEPVELFEIGPGNGWLARAWAARAPHPQGGSYAIEIYRRLPNDTDFSILKRLEVPGLNFAAVGDSYAYHTARDVPDRLPARVVQRTGENVVTIVNALDAADITQRSGSTPTYFDIGRRAALSFGPATGWTLGGSAILLGLLAFVRAANAVIKRGGVGRLVLALIWASVALLFASASMVGVTWALRAARQVNHPWYAHPDRLLLLLASTGLSVSWAVSRLGAWLPGPTDVPRHPATVWALALPVWIVLAGAALWLAPSAAYLWTIPLFCAGLLLAGAPLGNAGVVRFASVLILVVAATLWLRQTVEVTRFMVAVFGRLPVVTPIYAYGALLAAAGLMLTPPFIAITAPSRPLLYPSLMTALCLTSVAAAWSLAYIAPAYTPDRPLRRTVRAIQEGSASTAIWDVGSTEPGLDLQAGAPSGWIFDRSPPVTSVPVGRFAHPFVFRANGPSLGPPPARITSFVQVPIEGGVDLTVTVVPQEPGLAITFAAPPGVTPGSSSLPGIARLGRWSATFAAPPSEGAVWRASFASQDIPALAGTRVIVTAGRMPGGAGWQQLPGWLPQERTVWTASAAWILEPPPPEPEPTVLEPVPPLR